jgi:hypothetical protein
MRKCTAKAWVKPIPKDYNRPPHKNGYWVDIAGVFHQFGTTFEEFENGAVECTYAIVEDIEGQVWEATVESLKFDEPYKEVNP